MHEHAHPPQHHTSGTKHKPVVLVVAVVLMIVAMLMYVMSEDEALPPGSKAPTQAMPAAPGG